MEKFRFTRSALMLPSVTVGPASCQDSGAMCAELAGRDCSVCPEEENALIEPNARSSS